MTVAPQIAALINTQNEPFYYWRDAGEELFERLKTSHASHELVGCAIAVEGEGVPPLEPGALMGITAIDRMLDCNLAWWLVTADRVAYVMFEVDHYVLMPLDKERENILPWLPAVRAQAVEPIEPDDEQCGQCGAIVLGAHGCQGVPE